LSARDLIVIGGGEHARVVIEAAQSMSDAFRVVGFCDPRPMPDTVARLGLPWLGGDEACLGQHAATAWFVLGVGTVGVSGMRAEIAARFAAAGARFATVFHRTAWISPTASVGSGTVAVAGVSVNTGARVGAHVIINTGAIVEHDVVLGDACQVGPGAVIGGGVSVGAGAFLGLGCRIRDHITIGPGATVGMGAVAVADVPAHSTVTGVPARVLGATRKGSHG
jgi:acetyltransferase EpsM